MHKVKNCLIETNELPTFANNTVQNIRQAVLTPVFYKPDIQQALQRVNFKFHRTCSFSNIIRECNVAEGQTLLIFWGSRSSDSRVTISMSASSCSSLHMTPTLQTPNAQRDRELKTIAQQTEISCRYLPGPNMGSPAGGAEAEEQRVLRARLADSLTFSSPATSAPPPSRRSASILGSVCALLLNKQGSTAKEVSGVTGVTGSESDNICRICFGGESGARLLRPCACRGTVAAVHRACLERWLLQAATSYCELCRHHYAVTRSHKWSWARSLAEWARAGHGRALLADASRAGALGAASVLGTARALHACDAALQAGARRGGGAALLANLFSSLLIGIIGALNGLLTTWMLLKIQEHQMSWRAWRDSTLHVRVSLGGGTEGAGGTGGAGGSGEPSREPSASSLATVVGEAGPTDRATNVADPFMVALPYTLPDP